MHTTSDAARIRRCIIDRDVHIPEGTSSATIPKRRQNYLVTETGINGRYARLSLFENPVSRIIHF